LVRTWTMTLFLKAKKLNTLVAVFWGVGFLNPLFFLG
jgi:hypothetical protein